MSSPRYGLMAQGVQKLAQEVSRLSIAVAAQYRFECGIEIPQSVIIVAPHRSMFDLPAGMQTFAALGVRPLIVVKQSVVDGLRLPKTLIRGLNMLPVSSDAAGRKALLTEGSDWLGQGGAVAIMPEGRVVRRRTNSVDTRSGASELALATKAQVLVLGSAGTEKLWVRGLPSTYVRIKRTPIVVVATELIRPEGSLAEFNDRLSIALTQAEARAQAQLIREFGALC